MFFSAVRSSDHLSILFVLIAVGCLCGAAYLAWLRNLVGAFALVFVAVVAVVLGAD